jgi:hypothetical protein
MREFIKPYLAVAVFIAALMFIVVTTYGLTTGMSLPKAVTFGAAESILIVVAAALGFALSQLLIAVMTFAIRKLGERREH